MATVHFGPAALFSDWSPSTVFSLFPSSSLASVVEKEIQQQQGISECPVDGSSVPAQRNLVARAARKRAAADDDDDDDDYHGDLWQQQRAHQEEGFPTPTATETDTESVRRIAADRAVGLQPSDRAAAPIWHVRVDCVQGYPLEAAPAPGRAPGRLGCRAQSGRRPADGPGEEESSRALVASASAEAAHGQGRSRGRLRCVISVLVLGGTVD